MHIYMYMYIFDCFSVQTHKYMHTNQSQVHTHLRGFAASLKILHYIIIHTYIHMHTHICTCTEWVFTNLGWFLITVMIATTCTYNVLVNNSLFLLDTGCLCAASLHGSSCCSSESDNWSLFTYMVIRSSEVLDWWASI